MRRIEEVEGRMVKLRTIQKDELSWYMNLYRDPEFKDDFGYVEGVEQSEAQLMSWFEGLKEKDNEWVYSVFESKSLNWIGFVTLMDVNEVEQEAWIVIGLEEKWRNQGYGRQILNTLIPTAFTEVDLRVLKLSVLAHNKRAITLYERLGFEIEMIYPKLQCPNLFDVDIIQYQLTRSRWKQLGI